MDWKNSVIRNSILLMILINLGNLANFVFHFVMGRMLPVADYASLVFLTNIIGIFGVAGNSIQTIVSKKTTHFITENRKDKIKGMLNHFFSRITLLAILIFLVYLVVFWFLKDEFKIEYGLIILSGLLVFFFLWAPILNGVVQGMKNFGSLGSSFLFSMLIKLGFAILLTYFGFKVYGAITGIVLGGIVSIIILIFTINPIIKEKAVYENFKIRTRENMNIFLAMALIVVFYSLDIILVKFFFSAEIAGEYGAVSTIAKIGLFGTMAVGNAMFPISSERFEKKESSKSIFMKSLGLVSIIGLIFVILVFLFPEQIVNLFYGEKYVALAPIAWKLAVGFIAISLLNLLLLYKISTNGFKTNKSIFMVGLLFLEIIGFFFFHKDISQFSKLFMIQNAIIFILSLILLKK